MTPLPNLANVIAGMPRAQQYSKMLDRFSAPYYDESLTRSIIVCMVLVMIPFSRNVIFLNVHKKGQPLNLTQKEEPVEAMLNSTQDGMNIIQS